MDFGNAALLGFVVFILVEFYNEVTSDTATVKSRAKIAAIIVFGQVAAVGVAHSDWGVKQIVSGIPLNAMNGVSLAIAGLAIAGLAAFGNKVGVKALSRVGQGDAL